MYLTYFARLLVVRFPNVSLIVLNVLHSGLLHHTLTLTSARLAFLYGQDQVIRNPRQQNISCACSIQGLHSIADTRCSYCEVELFFLSKCIGIRICVIR